MGDIRPPRSMDMARRPAAPRPQPQAAPQPIVQRPVGQAPIAQRPAQPAPVTTQPVAQPQPVDRPAKAPKAKAFWRGLLQVVVSLLVIVGVAAVIVALYLRYYQ